MNKPIRIALILLSALLCLCLPFVLCSPVSLAEEAKSLPMDFSEGSVPDENGWTDDGYSDETITVAMETVEADGVVWRIAWVTVGHASQLRTATAGKPTDRSTATAKPSSMARAKNAIVAINGDYFADDPDKTTFEYRMGQKIRHKTNKKKDILIIDNEGNFHTFIKSGLEPAKTELETYLAEGGTIANAFTFGPVLVKGGEKLTMDTGYGYNPNGREPRAAIGQTGPLSYVLVVAEGRSEDSKGATHQELADFMYDLGCIEAFNLDGGGSASMIFHDSYYMDHYTDRAQSDIIYFASAR